MSRTTRVGAALTALALAGVAPVVAHAQTAPASSASPASLAQPAAGSPSPTPAPSPTPGTDPSTLRGSGVNDRGPNPTVLDIDRVTLDNRNYRDTFWTGTQMQLTVMSIKPKDDIGLEVHPSVDQFIRIESGTGIVRMGPSKNHLTFRARVDRHSAVLIPHGTWHDVTNTGRHSMKLYSLYAPPNHPHSTLHPTKTDADNDPLEVIFHHGQDD